MNTEKLAKLISLIEQQAAKPAYTDDEDFNPDDVAGGNIDDAFYAGIKDGKIIFAQELMNVLN